MANKTTYELALEIGGKIQSSLEKSVGGVNKKLDSIGKAAKTAAKIATAAFAAVKIGDFVKDAVSVYADFDQAMANTAATAGATGEEYAKLEAAALEMGKKTTKTATEASEALGYMALAGWDVNTSISALEPVLRLSEATGMDLATCSDLVTDSMSALGLTVDELSGYLDVACKANNKSNQTAQQLMEAYIGCGGVLNNLGVSVEDSATALGVLANRGIKGSEAGNKLNTVLINLTSGTGQAGAMMKKLGISAFDSEGKFIGLQETLQLVNEATKDLTEEERNAALAAIGGKTQIDTLNDLLSGLNTTTEDGRSEWQALNDELYNAQGAMMDMAGKVTDTLPGAMAVFGSAVDDAKIRLCKIFAPMAKDAIFAVADHIPKITDKVTGFIQTLSERAVPAIASFKDKAVAFFGMVRPILEDVKNKGVAAFQFLANTGKTAFENIKAKIEENKPAIDKVIAVALDLKDKFFEAFEKAKPVISFIATTAIPAVVGAIMKVIGAAATVYQKLNEWGALKPIIIGIAGAVASVKMVGFAKDTLNSVKAVKALITVFSAEKKAMLANIALKIKDKAETLFLHALYAKDAVVKGISTAATWAQTAAMTAFNAVMSANPIALVVIAIVALVAAIVVAYKKSETFRAIVAKAFETIKNVAGMVLPAIAEFFKKAWAEIQSVWNTVKPYFQQIWDVIKQVFSAVSSVLGKFFRQAWEVIQNIWQAVQPFFQSLWNTIEAIFKVVAPILGGFFKSAWAIIKGVWQIAGQYFALIWNNIKAVFVPVVQVLASFFTNAWEAIKAVWNVVTGFFEMIWNTISGIFSVVQSVLSGDFQGAWDAIKSIFAGFGQFFQTLWDGVVAIFGAVVSFFGSVFQGAWDAITGVFGNIVGFFGGVWDSIVSVFGTIGTAIADAISGAVKGAINAVLSGAVSIINGFIAAINVAISIINAIPGVSINKISPLEVPALATGGIVAQPTLAMIGEGNDSEAVIPLGELWSNMKSIVAGAVNQPGSGGAADMFGRIKQLVEGGQAVGQEGGSVTKELYNTINNNNTVNRTSETSSTDDSQRIVYSPQVIIQGNASKEDVQSALDMSQEKFNQMMAEYNRQNRRTSFAPA